MPDERTVDDHLAAVYDAVLFALYQTKQAAWSAASTPFAGDLRDLRDFLIEQSRLVDEAETRIGGRSERLSTPSSYQQGNLAAESGGDVALAVRTLTERLVELVSDVGFERPRSKVRARVPCSKGSRTGSPSLSSG